MRPTQRPYGHVLRTPEKVDHGSSVRSDSYQTGRRRASSERWNSSGHWASETPYRLWRLFAPLTAALWSAAGHTGLGIAGIVVIIWP